MKFLNRILFAIKYAIFHQKTWQPALYMLLVAILYVFLAHNPFLSIIEKNKANKLNLAIENFQNIKNSKANLDSLIDLNFDKIGKSDLQHYSEDYINHQIYNTTDNSLQFWTKKSRILYENELLELDSMNTFISDQNNNYLINKVIYKDKTIVNWFDINLFVASQFYKSFTIFGQDNDRADYQILRYKAPNSVEFKDKNGQFLFSILETNYNQDIWIFFKMICLILLVLFFVKSFFNFGKHVSRVSPISATIIFFGVIYGLRKLLLYLHWPKLLYTLKLFNPSLYSSEVTPSLGDLFIFVISTQFIIIFIKRTLRLNVEKLKYPLLKFSIHTLALIFLLGEAFSVNKIFERMVVESSIWFNFNYFPRLTIYSFIGFAIMMLTFSNYMLLTNFIVKNIVKLELSGKKIFLSFSILMLVIIGINVFTFIKFETKATFCILWTLILISYIKYHYHYYNRLFNLFLFVTFATITTSFLLYFYNIKKDEAVLSSIASNIAFGNDKKLENSIIHYFKNPNQDSFNSELKSIHIQPINDYDYEKLGSPSNFEKEEVNLELIVYQDSNLKLFLLNSENDKKYIVEKTTLDSQKLHFSIYPKNYLNTISKGTKKLINDIVIRDEKISYALYINNQKVETSGEFPYLDSFLYSSHSKIIKENKLNTDFQHNIFPISDQLKVIVTTSEANAVSILTQFSYIFCFNLLLFTLIQFLGYSLRIIPSDARFFRFANLRSKIVFSIFMIVLTIFAGIAYFSYTNLKSKFKEYNKNILLNNLKFSLISIDNFQNLNQKSSIESFKVYFQKIANENLLDYNIYSKDGKFIFSTNFENINEVETSVISPLKIWKLNHEGQKSFDIKESNLLFDQFEALTIYESSTNSNDKFYISINSRLDITDRSEAMKMIVILLNLYVILFLISMLFALWMANKITQPLKNLTDKITNLNITKQNEYLDYKHEDEIGELVKRYNQMIDEIRFSTLQLAASEREEAWSEMAKQIAHEIKNPLTPMKLKIQFLQRKIKEGADGIPELSLNVSETLIEQINNLDNIATSFSNYSRLHSPTIDVYEWSKIIKTVIYTFDTQESPIEFNSRVQTAFVACDQNQMISCLNNLIKNAIQAYDVNPAKLEVNLTENKSFYILEIKDFGKGIDLESQALIFSPKFTTKTSGTGLGLAISKKIVESFLGKIKFESVPDEGTSFFISLPKVKNNDIFELSKIEVEWTEKGFVDLQSPDIYKNLVYAQSTNVFDQVLYKNFRKTFLHSITEKKLNQAIDILKSYNPQYRLIVLDALRPYAIQQKMWDIYNDENKKLYIASPEHDSMHNYGMAVDVLIIHESNDNFESNKQLDFGCEFDEFSEKAHFNYNELNFNQKANRELLREVMTKAGFIAYENEFWHFEAMDKDWVRANCERI